RRVEVHLTRDEDRALEGADDGSLGGLGLSGLFRHEGPTEGKTPAGSTPARGLSAGGAPSRRPVTRPRSPRVARAPFPGRRDRAGRAGPARPSGTARRPPAAGRPCGGDCPP